MGRKRRIDKFIEKGAFDPDTGFSYFLNRSPYDYFDDVKNCFIANGVVCDFTLITLTEVKKEKSEESYNENIKDTIDEISRFDKNFFKSYSKRVNSLFSKVMKKEDHIINILKKSSLSTATIDIRKMRKLHNGIKELVFMMSYDYDGLVVEKKR